MLTKATTLRVFPATWHWKQCLAEARRTGYTGVELNFDGMFDLPCPARTLRAIKHDLKKHRLQAVSVYSRQQWKTPISSPNKAKSEQGKTTLKQLIEIAAALEAPSVLTIPGAVDNSILSPAAEQVPYDEVYDRTLRVLGELAPLAEKKGIVLALENVPNKFLMSPLEFRDFIDRTGSRAVGCHFDVANCLYNRGYPEHWISILGMRIKAVHFKDFRLAVGNLNGFTDIFEGDINWPEVCRALARGHYRGPLISEVLPACKHHPETLWISAATALDKIRQDIIQYRREMDLHGKRIPS